MLRLQYLIGRNKPKFWNINCTFSSGTRELFSTSAEFQDDNNENSSSSLYPTHIETSSFQKCALSLSSSVVSILNPRRHDMIAVFGEVSGHKALHQIYSSMLKSTEGSDIIFSKPKINTSTVDLKFLASLNESSLGFQYHKFLVDNNVTPDSRMQVKFVDDTELAFVMQRYREIHDLVHTVLGMPTNMQGEVAVKWVEALQTGLPMCISGAILGPLRFKKKQRKDYLYYYLPWALKIGKNASPLMNIYFEKRWEQNIEDLRKELNIDKFEKPL